MQSPSGEALDNEFRRFEFSILNSRLSNEPARSITATGSEHFAEKENARSLCEFRFWTVIDLLVVLS